MTVNIIARDDHGGLLQRLERLALQLQPVLLHGIYIVLALPGGLTQRGQVAKGASRLCVTHKEIDDVEEQHEVIFQHFIVRGQEVTQRHCLNAG